MAKEVIWTEREETRRPEHNIEEENTEIQNRRKRKKTQTKAEQKQREELKRKIDDRKEILDLISWDGNTRENTPEASTSLILSSPPPPPYSISQTLSFNANNEEDSEYPKPPPEY